MDMKMAFLVEMKVYLCLALVCKFVVRASAGYTCLSLNATRADLANGYWYPKNCTQPKVPVRTRCYFRCKKSYVFDSGAQIETECTLTKYIWPSWKPPKSYLSGLCKAAPVCPPLDSVHGKRWHPASCNTDKQSAGQKCKALTSCKDGKGYGVQEKTCLANGTWSPLGGFYCKPDPDPLSIICEVNPVYFTTDPGKPTADVTSRLPMPRTSIDESEIEISTTNYNLSNLPVGLHDVTFTSKVPPYVKERKHCILKVYVKDKEPPKAIQCQKEAEFITPMAGSESLKTSITLGPVSFKDNVDGVIPISKVKVTKNFHNSIQPVGEYKETFAVKDSHANWVNCKVQITVRGRPCFMPYPPLNAEPYVHEVHNRIYVRCSEDLKSVCDAKLLHLEFDSKRCAGQHISASDHGVTCNNFVIDAPLPSCVKNSERKGKVNGSCPVGTVVSYFDSMCIPCPRGMFYNITRKDCQLCPDNTTSYIFGSLNCTRCPLHKMTKLKMAPRFCEPICEQGWILNKTTNRCMKCPFGTYAVYGATSCSNCPNGLTTLFETSTNPKACVLGGVLKTPGDFSKGRLTVSPSSVTSTTLTACRYRIESRESSRVFLYQYIAIKVDSRHLKSITDCSLGYIMLLASVKGVEYNLTDKICGNMINQTIIMDYMQWRSHIIEYYFHNKSKADMQLSYKIGHCQSGQYFDMNDFHCKDCPPGKYQDDINAVNCKTCVEGKITINPGSVACIDICHAGYYRGDKKCKYCPYGFYQDKNEQTSCIKCPNGTTTLQKRSTSKTNCTVACNLGYRKHGTSCVLCPFGTYQDENSPNCIYCLLGKTTLNRGSTSRNDCVAKCAYEGEYFDTSMKKCRKCPTGTYKLASAIQVIACTSCPANHTTLRTGAVSKTECKDLVDDCKSSPCKFPGRCEDVSNGFKCICPYLYTGERCQTELHPCASRPCQNGGICHNQWVFDYYCDCKKGFSGTKCETNINECTNSKCNTTGTLICKDGINTYPCVCKKGYRGNYCSETGCHPGEHYDRTCRKCAKGTYQPEHGFHLICTSCGVDQTTLRQGSRFPQDCIDLSSLVIFSGSVTITSIRWQNVFYNKTSPQFLALAHQVESTIKDVYINKYKVKDVIVAGFRNGSIICDFNVYFETEVKNPETVLQDSCSSGTLGKFSVDRKSITLKLVTDNSSKWKKTSKDNKKRKGSKSTIIIVVVVVVFAIIGCVTVYLIWSNKKNRFRVRFDKMMNDASVTMEPLELLNPS